MANFDFKKITLPNGDVGTVTDATAQNAAAEAADAARQLKTNLDNNTYSFLTYKDNTYTEAQIKALTSAKVGDFYIASDTGTAWVCVTAINGTASASSWEKAGSSADVSAFVTAVDAGAITDTVPQTFEGHQVSEFVLKTDVVNNLTSTATNVPLSAAQGKALKDSIDTLSQTSSSTSENVSTLSDSVTSLSNDVTVVQSSLETVSQTTTNLSNNKLNKSGGTMTGTLVAQNNTSYTTKQVRNIIISTSSPTGGSNGDIWIKYTS